MKVSVYYAVILLVLIAALSIAEMNDVSMLLLVVCAILLIARAIVREHS